MAEVDPLSWREKLEVLKRLPKPAKSSPGSSPTNTPTIDESTPNLYGSAGSRRHLAAKDIVKFKWYSRREDEDPYMPLKNQAEVYEMCGYNDLLNPCISTEERFDKYLLEMKEMEEIKAIQEAKAQDNTNFLPNLVASQDPSRPQYVNSDAVWDRKYDLRGKGGGWRILPRIERSLDDQAVPARLSLSCVTFNKDNLQTLSTRGHHTAR